MGVRRISVAGRAVSRRTAEPHLPDRPFPRGAVIRPPRGRPHDRAASARRRRARRRRRRMVAQPGQRRPATRRRPAGRLAATGPGGGDGVLSSCRIRRGGGGRGDTCRTTSRLARRAPRVRSMTIQAPADNDCHSRRRARMLLRGALAGLVGILAAVLVACGGSGAGLIPASDAGPLQKDFEEIAAAAQRGNGSCASTEAAIAKTEQDFRALPGNVDNGLRTKLRQGISNLRQRAPVACAQPLPQSTITTNTTTTAPPTSTTPTTTQTTPTDTTPSTTTTTPTTTGPGGGTPAPNGEPAPGGQGGTEPGGQEGGK